MKCPRCKNENDDEANQCDRCGETLRLLHDGPKTDKPWAASLRDSRVEELVRHRTGITMAEASGHHLPLTAARPIPVRPILRWTVGCAIGLGVLSLLLYAAAYLYRDLGDELLLATVATAMAACGTAMAGVVAIASLWSVAKVEHLTARLDYPSPSPRPHPSDLRLSETPPSRAPAKPSTPTPLPATIPHLTPSDHATARYRAREHWTPPPKLKPSTPYPESWSDPTPSSPAPLPEPTSPYATRHYTPPPAYAAPSASPPPPAESVAVTVIAIVGLVFGFLSLSHAFVPILGILAVFSAVPALMLSALALTIAILRRASVILPSVGLGVSSLALFLALLQIGIAKAATDELDRRAKAEATPVLSAPPPQPQFQPTPTPAFYSNTFGGPRPAQPSPPAKASRQVHSSYTTPPNRPTPLK